MRQEVPLGGNLNQAVRVGDTVRRRAGPWTPAVHSLLRYLEQAGFEAPRVLGMDAQGREILAFIPGEAYAGAENPVPDRVFDEEHLVAAARLLRSYHDVVSGFGLSAGATWRLVAPTEHELICHNDWSPWNALFRDGELAVMLDWDLAGPGSRLWDVANAAAAWVTLFSQSKLFSLAERASAASAAFLRRLWPGGSIVAARDDPPPKRLRRSIHRGAGSRRRTGFRDTREMGYACADGQRRRLSRGKPLHVRARAEVTRHGATFGRS